MLRPRRSNRTLMLGMGMVLVGLTLVALLLWEPVSTAPSAPDAVAARATEDRQPEGRKPIPRRDGRTVGRGPEAGSLDAVETENRLNPHSSRGTIAAGRLAAAPPVADRAEPDPSIADPPAIPVIPLPPINVDPAATDRSNGGADPSRDWVAPESVENLRLDNLRLDQPRWPASSSLRRRLTALQENPASMKWAAEVATALRELEVRSLRDTDDEVGPALKKLEYLAQQAHRLANVASPLRLRADWLRAAYALERRVALWQDVAAILDPDTIVVSLRDTTSKEGFEVLGRIQSTLSGDEQAQSWSEYLRLADLESALRGTRFQQSTSRSELARTVLTRMHSHLLSKRQRDFLDDAPFSELESMLRHWVTEPIDYPQLVRDLEQYELYRGSFEARRIAAAYHIARWSNQPMTRRLGDHISEYYRNANARIAVAAELINHLLPQPPTVHESVDDQIAGARIFGRSRATGRLKIFLVPDHRHWRLGLESHGVVRSETQAARGPARFFHDTNAQYRAHKVFQVDQRGIRLWDAVADAEPDSQLTGMETDYDGVPLLNVLARALAMQQYETEQAETRWLLRRRVAERIEERFDEEVEKNLKDLKGKFTERFHDPMRRLELNPTPIELETTSTRLIARYRLAGDHQLAGHTPRPQAPGDAVLSFQVHESAVNNIVEQLKLDGRTVELKQLYRELGQLFQGKVPEIPEDIPDGVQLTFAKHDAVRILFGRDEITVTLALEKLAHKKRAWRHFAVKVTYRPDPQKLDATLKRVDYVRLKGRRLRIGDQVVLRGIFSKVFSRRPPVHLLGGQIAQDPRFAKFEISQFVVRGGWIGVALSPLLRGKIPQDVARSADEFERR